MALTSNQISFVRRVYTTAKNSDIDPLFVTAQACLESNYGTKISGKNNYFGVTKGSWSGPCSLITTHETFSRPNVKFNPPEQVLSVKSNGKGGYSYLLKRYFRDYPNLGVCLQDHYNILRKYTDAWPYRHNGKLFAQKISDSRGMRYATGSGYAKLIGNIMDSIRKYV